MISTLCSRAGRLCNFWPLPVTCWIRRTVKWYNEKNGIEGIEGIEGKKFEDHHGMPTNY